MQYCYMHEAIYIFRYMLIQWICRCRWMQIGLVIACVFLPAHIFFDGGWRVTCSPPPLLSARRMEAFFSLLPIYERVARSSAGKVIALLFSLSSITGSVKPNRQAERAMTGPLIWQLLHITKQRAAITSKWRERGSSGERLTPLLCSAIFAAIFIAPLTCCAPGTFRGSIQVAKGEAWVEGLPSGWVVSMGNLPGGWACDTLRVHDRLFKRICICVFVLLTGVGGLFWRGVGVPQQCDSALWMGSNMKEEMFC